MSNLTIQLASGVKVIREDCDGLDGKVLVIEDGKIVPGDINPGGGQLPPNLVSTDNDQIITGVKQFTHGIEERFKKIACDFLEKSHGLADAPIAGSLFQPEISGEGGVCVTDPTEPGGILNMQTAATAFSQIYITSYGGFDNNKELRLFAKLYMPDNSEVSYNFGFSAGGGNNNCNLAVDTFVGNNWKINYNYQGAGNQEILSNIPFVPGWQEVQMIIDIDSRLTVRINGQSHLLQNPVELGSGIVKLFAGVMTRDAQAKTMNIDYIEGIQPA